MNKIPLVLFILAVLGLGAILTVQLGMFDEPSASETVREVRSRTRGDIGSEEGQAMAKLLEHFDARERRQAEQWEFIRWIQTILSVTLMGASLFVILSGRFRRQEKHWAFSVVGMIIGYWLNSARPM